MQRTVLADGVLSQLGEDRVRGFGLPYNGVLNYRLDSIASGELVLVMSDGNRETWTRAPAD